MKEYKIAVLGATGAVGREMVKVLEEYGIPVSELRLLASARSAGGVIPFRGKEIVVQEAREDSFAGCDYVLGAVQNPLSKRFAPAVVKSGAVYIDNSSAFRMDPDVPLVVPEINGADALALTRQERAQYLHVGLVVHLAEHLLLNGLGYALHEERLFNLAPPPFAVVYLVAHKGTAIALLVDVFAFNEAVNDALLCLFADAPSLHLVSHLLWAVLRRGAEGGEFQICLFFGICSHEPLIVHFSHLLPRFTTYFRPLWIYMPRCGTAFSLRPCRS